VFYNESWKESFVVEDCVDRLAGSVELELPVDWVGEEVHCWIYFSKPGTTSKSASLYVAQVQL
jgi:Family of unknown function (DUF6266)